MVQTKSFILLKELAKKFEGKFECLGEKTEKNKTFSVPIEKEVANIDKDGDKCVVNFIIKLNVKVLRIIW